MLQSWILLRSRILLVAISATLSLQGCTGRSPEDHRIIDGKGKTTLELGSDSTLRRNGIGNHFVEGKIIRGDALRCRYMKVDGSYLPGEYYRCRNFSDGMAAVEPHFELNKEGNEVQKIGIIDAQGKLIIPAQFADVREFREDLCPVRPSGQDLWGVINKSGNWVVKPVFEEAQVYSQGLLAVQKDGLWGFADRTGNLVIAPQFAYANGFHCGFALVLMPGLEKQWACIKPDGKVAFKCLSDSLNEDKSFSIFDNPAVPELTNEHEQSQYSCGFSGARLRFAKDNKYGFYDTAGNIVVPPVYDYADNFSDDRAAVVKGQGSNAKLMYIDSDGKVIGGSYQKGRPYHESLAAVQTEKGEWIFIDKDGKQAFDGTFDSAHSFYDGRAVVNYLLSAPCL